MSCLFFGLLPSISFALGLGELKLNSHLNEPLDAQIGLVDIKGIEPSDIITSIADSPAFIKAGLEPSGWLNHIQFQITTLKNGKHVIQLSTKQPVKDPFADLLIQVAWPGGKIIKEYTILLDPPKASSSQSKIALAKVISEKSFDSPTQFHQSTKIQKQETGTFKQGKGALLYGSKYGPVFDETLWSIAKKLVENSDFTVQQGVVAIADKNMQAFYQGNINYIKQGSVLNLPTEQELSHYSEGNAQNFVESKANNLNRESFQAVQLEKEPAYTKTKEYVDDTQKPLKLIAPLAENDDSISKKNPELLSKEKSTQPSQIDTRQFVAQRLSLIEEAIDTLKRSNEDISQKNLHLQNQNETLAKQLILKEDEITHLRQVVVQKALLDGPVQPHEIATKSTMGPNKSYAVATPDTIPKIKSKQLPDSPEHHVKASSASPKVSPSRAADANSNDVQYEKHSDIRKDLIYIMFLFVLSCSVIGWLWFSRHRLHKVLGWMANLMNSFYRYKPQLKEAQKTPDMSSTDVQVNYGLHFDLEKALEAVSSEENRYLKPQVGGHSALSKQEQENLHKKSIASLEDAEIYIAYERYQQAEKILQEILKNDIAAQDPAYWDALLKLLELYVLTEKYHDYEKWYKTVPKDLKEISPKVWSKIVLLQEKVESEKAIHINTQSIEIPKTAGDTHLDLATHHIVESDSIPETKTSSAPIKQTEKLELVNDLDEVHAQISLAKAYMEVGDIEAARELLINILSKGTPTQQENVQLLLDQLNKK
jgi:FimV-like protein